MPETGGAVDAAAAEATRKLELERVSESLHLKFSDVPEMTAKELQERAATAKTVVVDVREPDEREVSMIPGSITPAEFESQLEQFRDSTVVCYCTIGYRSAMYAQRLRQRDIEAVNLRGSILAWAHEGLPLVAGDGSKQPTQRIHVYSDRFALQPAAFTPVKFSPVQGALGGIKFMARNKLPRWLGGSL